MLTKNHNYCLQCGIFNKNPTTGRPRKYCGTSCKDRAFRQKGKNENQRWFLRESIKVLQKSDMMHLYEWIKEIHMQHGPGAAAMALSLVVRPGN